MRHTNFAIRGCEVGGLLGAGMAMMFGFSSVIYGGILLIVAGLAIYQDWQEMSRL